MLVNIHWGNLEELATQAQINDVINKNISKLLRLFKKVDQNLVRLEIKIDFDQSHKRYSVTLDLYSPKSHHYISEQGYSFEEALNDSVGELRRKVRKTKEKIITLRRKTD